MQHIGTKKTVTSPAGAVVQVLNPPVDNAALLRSLQEGSPRAMATLFDRFGTDVERLVWHLLGADPEHDDIVQTVFLRALSKVGQVRKADALKPWLVSITINTVRNELKRRRYRRILTFKEPNERELHPEYLDDHDGKELMRRSYEILERLPADERIVFILRHMEGHEHQEIADTCGFSVATVKRRLADADKRFAALAQRDPLLASRVHDSADSPSGSTTGPDRGSE